MPGSSVPHDGAARSRPGRHGRRGCRRPRRHENRPVSPAAGGRLDPDRIRIQCGICVASASAVAEGYGLYDRHFRFRPAQRLDSVPGYRGHAPGGGCGAPPDRRSGDTHDPAVPRRPVATVLLAAGCLAAVTLTLAVSAVTHARIAGPVRRSPDFVVRLVYFDEQAIVVVAVACALIAAARRRSARDVALCVVVGAAVAAAGVLALSNAGTIDRCFGSLSIQYAQPPTAGGRITSPSSLALRQVVLGAALVSVVFAPAAHAAAVLAGRRIGQARLPAGAKALGWLAAGIAGIAAITGTALWGPAASAHGVEPAGSIGRDGWLRGDGYDVRLIPSWYALTQAGNPTRMVISSPPTGEQSTCSACPPVIPPGSRSTGISCFASAHARPCLTARQDCGSRVPDASRHATARPTGVRSWRGRTVTDWRISCASMAVSCPPVPWAI